MKKASIALILCLLALLFSASALAGADASSEERMVVVNPTSGERLNLRAAASKDSASLGKFYTGAVVTVDMESAGGWTAVCVGGWTAVCVGNLHGYMDSAYLQPYPYFNGTLQSYHDQLPVVTFIKGADGLALPKSNAAVVSPMGVGNRVRLLGVNPNGWCLVESPEDRETPFWVKSSVLDPAPSFASTGLSAKYPVETLRIVVNPDVTDRLNLREEPDGRSPSVGKYYTGTVVYVRDDADGWSYVNVGTEGGYMKNDYLVSYTEEGFARYAATQPQVKVANRRGSGLSFRSDPSSGRNIMQTIPNGQTVTVLGITANGFAYIEYAGTQGYVRGDKLQPAITFAK